MKIPIGQLEHEMISFFKENNIKNRVDIMSHHVHEYLTFRYGNFDTFYFNREERCIIIKF